MKNKLLFFLILLYFPTARARRMAVFVSDESRYDYFVLAYRLLYSELPLHMECKFGESLILEHSSGETWMDRATAMKRVILWTIYTKFRIRFKILNIPGTTLVFILDLMRWPLSKDFFSRNARTFFNSDLSVQEETAALEFLRQGHKDGSVLDAFGPGFQNLYDRIVVSVPQTRKVERQREYQKMREMLQGYETLLLNDFAKHLAYGLRNYVPKEFFQQWLSKDTLRNQIKTDFHFLARALHALEFALQVPAVVGSNFQAVRIDKRHVKLVICPQFVSAKEPIIDYSRLHSVRALDPLLGRHFGTFMMSQTCGIYASMTLDDRMFRGRPSASGSCVEWLFKNLCIYALMRSPFTWRRAVDREISKFQFTRSVPMGGGLSSMRDVYNAWSNANGEVLLDQVRDILSDVKELTVGFENLKRSIVPYVDLRRFMRNFLNSLFDENGWDNNAKNYDLSPFDLLVIHQELLNESTLHSTLDENDRNTVEERPLDDVLHDTSKLKVSKSGGKIGRKYADFLNFVTLCKVPALSMLLYAKVFSQFWEFRAPTSMREDLLVRAGKDDDFLRAWLMINCSPAEQLDRIIENIKWSNSTRVRDFLAQLRSFYYNTNTQEVLGRPSNEDVAGASIDKETYVLRDYLLGVLMRMKLDEFLGKGNYTEFLEERDNELSGDDLTSMCFEGIGWMNGIGVSCVTRRPFYAYRYLSSAVFCSYMRGDIRNNINKYGVGRVNLLESKSFTHKVSILPYSRSEAARIAAAARCIVSNFGRLSALNEVQCEWKRPLSHLAKVIVSFVRKFVPDEYDALKTIGERSGEPDVPPKSVSKMDRMSYAERWRREIVGCALEFYAVVRKNFAANLVKNKRVYGSLFSALAGAKWSGDDLERIGVPRFSSKLFGVPLDAYNRARDRFDASTNFESYERTMMGEGQSLPYSFFHALADIQNIAGELITRYRSYKRMLTAYEGRPGEESMFYGVSQT